MACPPAAAPLLLAGFSWVSTGTWVQAAARNGADVSHLFGGLALVCSSTLWITSQEFVRRRFYHVYKPLHHIAFWGFMLMGCAHTWALFWYFVPGMLLYAVDGVFRLHQVFAGRSGSLAQQAPGDASGGAAAKPGLSGVNAEVLKVELCPSETMCSLLLAAPEFGAAPAGIVWLNVPSVSLSGWHAFDYTASDVTVSADGRVCNGFTTDKAGTKSERKVALSVHIKAYSRYAFTAGYSTTKSAIAYTPHVLAGLCQQAITVVEREDGTAAAYAAFVLSFPLILVSHLIRLFHVCCCLQVEQVPAKQAGPGRAAGAGCAHPGAIC